MTHNSPSVAVDAFLPSSYHMFANLDKFRRTQGNTTDEHRRSHKASHVVLQFLPDPPLWPRVVVARSRSSQVVGATVPGDTSVRRDVGEADVHVPLHTRVLHERVNITYHTLIRDRALSLLIAPAVLFPRGAADI